MTSPWADAPSPTLDPRLDHEDVLVTLACRRVGLRMFEVSGSDGS